MLHICHIHKSLFPVLVALALTACSATSEVIPTFPGTVEATHTVLQPSPTFTPVITEVETLSIQTATPTLSPNQVSVEQFTGPILDAIAHQPPDYKEEFEFPSPAWLREGNVYSQPGSYVNFVDGEYLTRCSLGSTGRFPTFSDMVIQFQVHPTQGWSVYFRQWLKFGAQGGY